MKFEKECPNCRGTDILKMKRESNLYLLGSSRAWAFLFPLLPLLLLQNPQRHVCDGCGFEFTRRTIFAEICRILLFATIALALYFIISIGVFTLTYDPPRPAPPPFPKPPPIKLEDIGFPPVPNRETRKPD